MSLVVKYAALLLDFLINETLDHIGDVGLEITFLKNYGIISTRELVSDGRIHFCKNFVQNGGRHSY